MVAMLFCYPGLLLNFQPCEIASAEQLVCLSPGVDSDLLSLQPAKRQDEEIEEVIVQFYLSFKLDGVEKYNETNFEETLPEYSQINIYREPPDIVGWGDDVLEYKKGESIDIVVSTRYPPMESPSEKYSG